MNARKISIALLATIILSCPSVLWAQDPANPPPPAAAAPAAAPEAAPPVAAVEAVPEGPNVVLGLGAGAYIPFSDLQVSFLVGVDAAYQLPWLERRFGIGAGFAYSQPTTEGEISDSRVPEGKAAYESTMREMVLDFLVTFRFFDWGHSWSPHVGIGPVFYFLSHQVESLGVEQTETSTQYGFLGVLGADYRLGPGALVGEVRFPFATVGQRTTGDSNVGAASIVLGYRFRI